MKQSRKVEKYQKTTLTNLLKNRQQINRGNKEKIISELLGSFYSFE